MVWDHAWEGNWMGPKDQNLTQTQQHSSRQRTSETITQAGGATFVCTKWVQLPACFWTNPDPGNKNDSNDELRLKRKRKIGNKCNYCFFALVWRVVFCKSLNDLMEHKLNGKRSPMELDMIENAWADKFMKKLWHEWNLGVFECVWSRGKAINSFSWLRFGSFDGLL